MSYLGLVILGVHSALLLLDSCTSITCLVHCRVCTGQVQVVLQLAGWPQDSQRVILQLLHWPQQLEKEKIREQEKKKKVFFTRFNASACSHFRLLLK